MATALKLRSDIKKLKKAIETKGISAPIKQKLKSQLEKAENELATLKSTGKAPKKSSVAGTKTALTSLQKLVNRKKFSVYQGKGVDLKKDAGEGAMATGRRVSKGLKSNQFGSKASNKGNVYYEYRPNRLDVKQPKGRQKYPKLEDGGMMANGGKTVKIDEVSSMSFKNQYDDYEMIVISKEAEKDGGSIVKDRFLVSAKDINEAKEITEKLWLKEYGNSDLSIVKIMSDSLYKLKYSDVYSDGGIMADGGNVNSKFGYVAMYKGKRVELYADSKYQAQLKAAKMLGAKKSYDVSVYLAEVDGKPYINTMMAKGGKVYVDLFENRDEMPQKVKIIVDRYDDEYGEDISYQGLLDMQKDVERVGYTFDFGLDSSPYGLRPLGVEITQLEGYDGYGEDEMASGGIMADGGKLANGKYKYEKGDEGMFMGDEVRVVKLHNGFQQYEYDIIDEEGKVKSHGAAKREKFENQFRYFPKMAEGGYMADGGYVVINKGGDRYDGGIFYQIKKGDEIVKQGLIDGEEMVEFEGKKYDGLKSLAEGINAELKIEEMKYGGQMAEGGDIKKGDYVIVDNPVWKAALGNDKPVRRKVKMVIDTDVVFHDGSISQLKYVKKMEDGGVISNTHKID